jgi:hypothetical protein
MSFVSELQLILGDLFRGARKFLAEQITGGVEGQNNLSRGDGEY